jgi:predicted RNase H-like nuclease
LIAKDVGVQKKRIGGNFAVAHAVNNQELREYIRQIVPDVIFIILTLTKETQRKRIQVFVNTKHTIIERFQIFKNSTSGSTW